LPAGEAQFIADGEVYTGNFVKIALNVAHRVGGSGNELGDLLRSWFGARRRSAGHRTVCRDGAWRAALADAPSLISRRDLAPDSG
jgi:hypothetical protein